MQTPTTQPQTEKFIRLHQERFRKEPFPEDIRLFDSLEITPEKGIELMEELHDFVRRAFDVTISIMDESDPYQPEQ